MIFAVDMFNEGVDITSLDMVMFLRPTESPIVFLQQIGRGLRKSKGKDYLNVLDFIGNYEKAGKVRFFLLGKRADSYDKKSGCPSRKDIPDDCLIDFDMRLIDLFNEMERKQKKLSDLINDEYYRVKDFLGHRPSRLELFTEMDNEIYQLILKNSKANVFKHYLDYLNELGELNEEEKDFCKGIDKEFISLIENTNMTKVYKMPVLIAFYNKGNVRMQVDDIQLLASWKEFFDIGRNWRNLNLNSNYEDYRAISYENHIKKIREMPINFLFKSGKGFFVSTDESPIALCDELESLQGNRILIEQIKDVIEYRTMDYYSRRLVSESKGEF